VVDAPALAFLTAALVFVMRPFCPARRRTATDALEREQRRRVVWGAAPPLHRDRNPTAVATMKLIHQLLPVLVLASLAGACRSRDDAPASSEVETTSATIPPEAARALDPALRAAADAGRSYTEWTADGPRTRTAPDLNDMGMHHPPDEPAGACPPGERSRAPAPPRAACEP
jgi:hypothetical protein